MISIKQNSFHNSALTTDHSFCSWLVTRNFTLTKALQFVNDFYRAVLRRSLNYYHGTSAVSPSVSPSVCDVGWGIVVIAYSSGTSKQLYVRVFVLGSS